MYRRGNCWPTEGTTRNNEGDAIARCDAVAFPDSTKTTEARVLDRCRHTKCREHILVGSDWIGFDSFPLRKRIFCTRQLAAVCNNIKSNVALYEHDVHVHAFIHDANCDACCFLKPFSPQDQV
jgi:hypothetical protein